VELLYYVPREFCLVLSAASKQEAFAGETVKARVMELLAMPPYSDLAYVRSWLLYLFVDGTLPVNTLDWQSYDFNRAVIERRSQFFFRGLPNDHPFFRALKTQLGSLSVGQTHRSDGRHVLALRQTQALVGRCGTSAHQPVCRDLHSVAEGQSRQLAPARIEAAPTRVYQSLKVG
jgi:CDGSH-type Zn-finger protein